jgi:hypothetical protein
MFDAITLQALTMEEVLVDSTLAYPVPDYQVRDQLVLVITMAMPS